MSRANPLHFTVWLVGSASLTVQVCNDGKLATRPNWTSATDAKLGWQVGDSSKLLQRTGWRVCIDMRLLDYAAQYTIPLRYHKLESLRWLQTNHGYAICNEDGLIALFNSTQSEVDNCSDNIINGQSTTVLHIVAPKIHMTSNGRMYSWRIQIQVPQAHSHSAALSMHTDNRVMVRKDGKLRTMARKSQWLYTTAAAAMTKMSLAYCTRSSTT